MRINTPIIPYKLSLLNKLNLQLTVSIVTSAVGIGIASPGFAIPSTTDHPHGNPETPWKPPGAMNGPEHQHRDTHALNGRAIQGGGGDVTSTVDIGGGLGFGTAAVWDNRNWRFDRAGDQSLTNYAHGFISQGSNTAVRYRFVDSFDHDGLSPTPDINRWLTPIGMNMRSGINNAYSTWEAAVNGVQLNVNGIPVVRSIDFMEEVGVNDAADIDVRLTDAAGAGFDPVTTQLEFQFRNDYDFDDTVPIGPPPFPNDADGNGINDNSLDFTYTALHETGHSLGLGHFGIDTLRNLMVKTGVPLGFGVNATGIDAGSQDGARDLYTIPVPVSQREKTRATIGSQQNPSVTFNSTTNRLSFAPGTINFADLNGGFSQSVDPLFVGDPLLGATINITDLIYGGVTANGLHYFEPGVLTITKDGQTLLDATFDMYWLDSTLEDNNPIIDSFTILLTPTINNTIGSRLLDELNDIAYGGEYFLDFFFQSAGTDLVALTNGFTQDASVDVTYYLGPNGTSVPEPSSIFGLLTLAGLGLTRLRPKRSD